MTRRGLRIAIPKGRLQPGALETFAAAGLDVPDAADLASRRLLFTRGGIEWIVVKDGDVPVYVEFGSADAGISGLDQILEHEADVYQPVELAFGRCRMMLIGSPDAPPLTRGVASTIATKYPNVTRRFLRERGFHLDIVPLQGSVELAAVLNLAPYIVDLVETGETARVHRLRLLETIAEIRPHFIVNKSSYRRDPELFRGLIATLLEKSTSMRQVGAM
ncbi:MAG TPA: ATP phosphoribosyltransferase [Thermoanaerobaculia bacterium]|nr:ATP phosphoribosyltransferase [Thermoanaerobaculia bacterium]